MNRYQSIVILDLAINTGKDRKRELNKSKSIEKYCHDAYLANKRDKEKRIQELRGYLPK